VDDVEYTWDNNGNLLNNGVFSYMYDYANRLVSVEDMTTTVVYTYNGDGHRMAKAVDGVTTIYVVAVLGLSQVLVETTGGESVVYLYGHDLLAEEGGSGWAWHLGDGLGSVRQLADGDGEVTMAQGYTPFGVPLWDEGSGLTGYGFTGEQWEAYSQLLFLRARYYEPGTGSFLTRDPVTRNHPYQYAGANPIRFIDPAGLEYFPWADVYSCDHQGGPDLRDPYAYRLTWSDSVREVYLNAHRSPEEGGLGLRRPLIVGKDPGRAIAGGYDYRGIPCWVTNASGYGPPPPETRPRHRPWEWSISKQKTLLPLFNSFIGSCECTPFPKPVTLFVLEGFYEEGGKSAFEYWNSQQKGWDVRGTPFQETLVGDWYYEQGPEYRVYGPDSLMTRELMQHPCVWKAREEFCQAGCLDRYTKKCHDNLKEFPLSTIGRNVTDFGDCFLGWDTACANAVLGSRDVKIYNNGDGTATFTIRNVTGRQSATRSIFGKPGMPDKTRAQTRWDPNEQNWNPFGFDVTYVGITPGPRGWGGNLTQGYIWVEIMPCCQ
jgi:RHS repeat-associated protein